MNQYSTGVQRIRSLASLSTRIVIGSSDSSVLIARSRRLQNGLIVAAITSSSPNQPLSEDQMGQVNQVLRCYLRGDRT